jgi:hypothetical protein
MDKPFSNSRCYEIKTTFEGVELEGCMTFLPKDVSITMTKPYYGPKSGSHIMFQAPYIFTQESADRRGKEILIDIYKSCLIIEGRKEEVRRLVASYHIKREEYDKRLNKLRESKIMAEALYKRELINSKEFQTITAPIYAEINILRFKTSGLFKNIMYRDFSKCHIDNLLETVNQIGFRPL